MENIEVPDQITLDWLRACINWHGIVVTQLDFPSVHKLLGISTYEDLAEKNVRKIFYNPTC